jgi:LuxR family maltose regulon positive regulatory protein
LTGLGPGALYVAGVTTAVRAPDPPARDVAVRTLAPLDAKLRVAEVRPGWVARPELVERLRRGGPVAVITGPAGSGKTTLLAQWAATDPRPFAWLSVTESDNDVAVLTAYVARALDAAVPLSPEVLAGLALPGAHGTTVLLPRLGRALFERTDPIVLVIDDAHLLTAGDCRGALTVLISHLPPGSQLALASREVLAVATGRLRAQRDLVEVGPEDLALDARQGTELVQLAGLKLDPDASAALVARTEGWAAGLYLAALTLRAHDDPAASVSRFSGDDRVIAEYLRRELLDTLPVETVEFLSRTSVLDVLSAPLCDALLERADSQLQLEELERSNLFVIPLDRSGEQFRYHHLFADLLRLELRRREPGREADLHLRASRWFEEQGNPDAAVRHAYRGHDRDRAAELVWRMSPLYLANGRTTTVSRWLELFTLEEISARPPLALTAAWVAVTSSRTQPVSQWVELARRSEGTELPDGTPLASAIALLEAVAGLRGLHALADDAARAYALDREDSPFRAIACWLEGTACRLLGRTDDARARLEEGVQRGVLMPPPVAGCLAELALLAIGDDDWTEAARVIEQAKGIVVRHNLTERPAQVLVHATSALVLAHLGRPEARAEARHARLLLTRLDYISPWSAIEARIVLARAELLLGERDVADLLARETDELLTRFPDPGTLPDRLQDLRDRLARAAGDSTGYSVPLTTAELRVLRYLPTHLSFQAMADELFVSRNTVKTQAIAIYRKLGVSSRSDAVERATELGLLDR